MVHFSSSSSSPSRLLLRGAAALLLAAAVSACGGEEASECLPEPMAACTPDINTDFASIHRALFAQRCGTTGGACHGPDGRKGNLVLADADTAYAALMGMDGTQARVSPGDPACSLLLQRLESDDPAKRMPLGEDKLSEGLRCAVRTWIESGAAR
jgi:hypothetical protein